MTTPDDSFLDVYSAVIYAERAAFAAAIALSLASAQQDRDSLSIAEKAYEDAYCAAGFAYAATMSDGPFEIQFCRDDAERAKDAALAHAAQALQAALDVDPEKVRFWEDGYASAMRFEAWDKTRFERMSQWFEISNYEDIGPDEAREVFLEEFGEEPPALPDAQMIEETWKNLIQQTPHTFVYPKSFALLVERFEIDEDGNMRTPESLADVIASKLAAERGPKGECRYCGVSFDKAKESVNPGRCLQCDKTLITEMMAGIFDVFAYNPETGESVFGALPNADESDTDSPSLN
jgi:hypothetical protein